MNYDFNPFKKNVASAEEWLRKELAGIRTGMASPQILDGVRVDSYGTPLGLKEVGSVTIEGARSLRVVPWDKNHVKEIEKAITAASLGVSVVVDDQGLRVIFPELTAERRKETIKLAKDKSEEAKKQVRQHRDIVIKSLQAKEKEGGMGKDDIFRLKNEAQKIVDEVIKKIDDQMSRKEKELLG